MASRLMRVGARERSRLPRRPLFDIIPAMKMHPSHRPCLFALAALPARSRTIDLRGNVTHTGNLGSVPKVPILKYRIILRGQANIMRIACAVAGSVPRFSHEQFKEIVKCGYSERIL